MNFQDRFHIVLVEPQESMNVGSVARSMMNFGFTRLHLVSPRGYKPARASMTACWASSVLEEMQIHTDFAEAIASAQDVVGFSSRDGKNRSNVVDLGDWTAGSAAGPARVTALVFGPEDTGLRNEHLDQCTTRVCIPTGEAYPSLNLAHAVTLGLYEIFRTHRGAVPVSGEQEPAAEWNDHFQLDRLVERSAQMSNFIARGTPSHIPGLVKQLFRRIKPSQREVAILLGLFGCIERTLDGRSPVQKADS